MSYLILSSPRPAMQVLHGNEYAVSIYDGHKEEWTLMGFSAWGWCYAPLLLTTFIAQTTMPSHCKAAAWPSASEFTFVSRFSSNVSECIINHVSASSVQDTHSFGDCLDYNITWKPVIWINIGRQKESNPSLLPQISWHHQTCMLKEKMQFQTNCMEHITTGLDNIGYLTWKNGIRLHLSSWDGRAICSHSKIHPCRACGELFSQG